jgi:hypothetical protein
MAFIQKHGKPYPGMLAEGDEGQVYIFDGFDGFFKKLFKRIKKGFKKIGRRFKKFGKRLLRRIPGGKYLIKLGGKIRKVAMKLVKPLVKFVGKYAAKLAPIAACIPGYGPAISAALYKAGKVARLMKKFGVKLKGKKGKARGLKFKSAKKANRFQKALAAAAKQERARQRAAKKRRRGKKVQRRKAPAKRPAPVVATRRARPARRRPARRPAWIPARPRARRPGRYAMPRRFRPFRYPRGFAPWGAPPRWWA